MGTSPFFFRRDKMLNRGLDKLELLRIVEAVANEKSIDKELVIESMESAIQKAALTKFGNDNNIQVVIDRESGDIKIQKVLDIVEKVEDTAREVALEEAQKNDPKNNNLKVGEKVFEELPQIDFGRIAAQSAKQVISSRVREAEKNRQYEDFIDKQGQILSGIIKRLEYGNVIVDLGKAEGVIKKDELIPREILKTGDRVKAYCYEVKKELKGHQIFLSRAHPQFLAKLFFQEVPEIYEGTIEIKSVARDPGSRAKICVYSQDSSIDPVGACVGMRGSRVQTIVNELHGEKIDIIKWTEDLPTLISESLSPAEIQRVLIDQDNKRIDIILSEENLSKAIGRRGQNVRLASKLTNFEIDILTDKEDSERRQSEFKERTETLIKNLEVDETLGQLLVSEGFVSIDEIAQSNPEDISKIEAIDEETANELITRSKETLVKEKEAVALKLKDLGVEEKLINLKGMTQGMLVILGQKNIKKIIDFADLSSDELIGGYDEIKGKKIRIDGYLEEFSLSRKEADDLIMAAREIAYN
jgi:transcription termination/antitermination protein NusA